MIDPRIEKNLIKIGKGKQLNKKETKAIQMWAAESAFNREVFDLFMDKEKLGEWLSVMRNVPSDRMRNTIRQRLGFCQTVIGQ